MAEDKMFAEAMDAVSKGQRMRARDLLTRLLKTGQNNPDYWLWMSSVVDTPSERTYCLENVLKLDPNNESALRGLILMGSRKPGDDLKPNPTQRRKWGVATREVDETKQNRFVRLWSKPVFRYAFFTLLGAIVVLAGIGVVSAVANNIRSRQPIAQVTITSNAPQVMFTATATSFPTTTPVERTATPTFVGPTPLWMFLQSTYTPAPQYVNTPHSMSEAYMAGMRAMARGDYQSMLSFMKQASQIEPNSADTRYWVGEAERLLNDCENALEEYNTAVTNNPTFAPAYVGRARCQMILKSNNAAKDIEKDLQKAIELDPKFADAYLVRASYSIAKMDPKSALEDLKKLEELAAYNPTLYVLRAQADMQAGDNTSALEDARHAFELDQTLLPVYLILGQAYLANGNPEEAIKYASTYLLYQENDDQGYLLQGKILFAIGKDMPKALDALTNALELNSESADAYYQRGLVYLEMEDGQKAVNDIDKAQRLNPDSFDYKLAFGRALLAAGRPNDAYRQLKSLEPNAKEDAQLAGMYYWRAQALEALGNPKSAVIDWKGLLALPKEAVPVKWVEMANQHLLAMTPSPTPTATKMTPTPKATATVKVGGTPTATTTTTPTPAKATTTPKP